MADLEAHIRDLQKRVEREPGSRYFVPLADELRKAGRLPDAIAALESGLVVHPGYVAARIALGRAYLEAGRIESSMEAFARALADDPSNLVAAKALGDLHLSRGEPLEALKRYRLYRAISGDRRLDVVIDGLEGEAARAQRAAEAAPAPPPPRPPAATPDPVEPIVAPPELAQPFPAAPPAASRNRHTDPFDISGISYKRPTGPAPLDAGEPEVPSRDLSLDAFAESKPRRDDDEIVTRKIRLPAAMWPFEPEPPALARADVAAEPEAAEEPALEPEAAPEPAPRPPKEEPSGKTLADLYFEQGHYSEALDLY
ncbi:MAG TPA: tetratricopeptide repeat protein, partial [Thermoanaerobaculia bacterium]|nr:tetratricopeptide repeat protein [Thermoanaerobaculia bacterium]